MPRANSGNLTRLLPESGKYRRHAFRWSRASPATTGYRTSPLRGRGTRSTPDTRQRHQKLPPDPVVLAVVARPAPERAVRAVDQDGVDRARGAVLERHRVAHAAQFAAHPGRRRRS